MKETVAVASWAVLLLSDLGQSHLLLGKSHVQKNGVNGCESEAAVGERCREGMEREREGERVRRRWMEGRREAAGRRSVLWADREGTERQKRDRGVKKHREVETGRRRRRPGDRGEREEGNEKRGGCLTENMKEKWETRRREGR